MLVPIPHLNLLFGCERRGSFRRRRGGSPASGLSRHEIGCSSQKSAPSSRKLMRNEPRERSLQVQPSTL